MYGLAVKVKRSQFSINLTKDLNYIPNIKADLEKSILNLFNSITVAGKTLTEAIGDANYIYDEMKNIVKVYKCKISNKANPNKLFVNFLTKKQVGFDDFTSFVLLKGVVQGQKLWFVELKDYKKGKFDNARYAQGENDVWNALKSLVGMDYDTMEKNFESVRFKDNENTCIVKFDNGKEYVILRK